MAEGMDRLDRQARETEERSRQRQEEWSRRQEDSEQRWEDKVDSSQVQAAFGK